MTFKEQVIEKANFTKVLVEKNSPQLLLGSGIVLGIAAVLLAIKSTKDGYEEQKDIHEENLLDAESYLEETDDNESYKRILLKSNIYYAASLTELYLPTIVVGSLSIASLIWSHRILTARNATLSSMYAATALAYKAYRARVREELGEDVDDYFATMKPREGKELKVVEGGKQKAVDFWEEDKDLPGEIVDYDTAMLMNPYSKAFTEESAQWRTNHKDNQWFLQTRENYLNQRLQALGIVFLNEVYDSIGVPITTEGQLVGWIKDNPLGDGYISLGIDHPANSAYFHGKGSPDTGVIIMPNCDGEVYRNL